MNTTRFVIMALALGIAVVYAAPPAVTPVADTITEVLLAQAFDAGVAGREPLGWFAIRSGDGQCIVTRGYAASIAQSFRIGCSPIWDGLYGYGFATPPGGIVRVEARVLCDTVGSAKPYLGVKIGRFFYELVSDIERDVTRWSNGDGRWSFGPPLVLGQWNCVRLDVDVLRGVARYSLNGRIVLDNARGVPPPEFARVNEAIYLGVIAGAAGVAYFDDITVCQMSRQSLPLIHPAQPMPPMRPPVCPMMQGNKPCGMPPMAGPPPAQMMKKIRIMKALAASRKPCEMEHHGKGKKPCGMMPCDKGKKPCGMMPCDKGKKPCGMMPCDKGKKPCGMMPCDKGKKPCGMMPCDKGKKPCGGTCTQGKPCSHKCEKARTQERGMDEPCPPPPPAPPCGHRAW
jgi:hypothetical protein